MARSRSLVVVSLLVGTVLAGLGGWSILRPSPDAQYLVNRLWAERIPRGERDMVHFLVAIDDGDQRVGAGIYASSWRQQTDLFRFRLDGTTLKTEWPQERVKADLQVKTAKCKAPEPFTLCLDLEGKNGKKARFYSREDWTLDRLDDADELPPAARAAARGTASVAALPACAECEDGEPASLY